MKLIWISTDGRAYDVVTCSGWKVNGATLEALRDDSCLDLMLHGASVALCVGCSMFVEQLQAGTEAEA